MKKKTNFTPGSLVVINIKNDNAKFVHAKADDYRTYNTIVYNGTIGRVKETTKLGCIVDFKGWSAYMKNNELVKITASTNEIREFLK